MFKVGFSEDEDVMGGADVVANGLEFAVGKTADVLGEDVHGGRLRCTITVLIIQYYIL